FMLDQMGSGFVQTERHFLRPVNDRIPISGGDWAELELTWIPDASFGLEDELIEVATDVAPGDRVVMRTDRAEFGGEVYDMLNVRAGPSREGPFRGRKSPRA